MSIQITKRPFDRSFSGNPVHYELTSAAAATDANIFFEIRLMFRYLGGVFAEVHRFQFYPTAGIAEVNVQDLLHSQLDWFVPIFPVDEKSIQSADAQSGEYYIEFREVTPTDQNPAWDVSELDFIRAVLRGGINYFKWRGNNFWVNYYDVVKPFLTWQQSGRLAILDERMFLSYICNSTLASVEARCKVTYMDSTTATVSKAFIDCIKDKIYFIPSGAAQWGLPALDPTKQIWYWEIYVVDVSDPASPQTISDLFRYEASNQWNLNDITLHYRNSLGGLDSVLVRGVLDENLDYQFQQQNRTFKPDYFDSHVITAQTVITESREQQTWKGDIGHLGREEQDRLRDAQIQRDVYLESSKKWWPVNIVTKNFKLRSTNDMRFTMPIEFTLAYDGAEYYTPKAVDLGDGVFTSNVCLASVINFQKIAQDDAASGLPAGKTLVTFVGNENDPQNASIQFQYRFNGGPWFFENFADLPSSLQVQLDLDTDFVMDYQAICTGGILGKKYSLSFTTSAGAPPPPPVFPITIAEISNTGTPGSTRTQVEEFNGVNVNDVLPAGVYLDVTVYSHTVSVGPSDGTTDTLNTMLNALVAAVNATTAVQWNDHGSAPASGTPGFKPTASHAAGSNRITLVLNYGNVFAVSGHW
jgi:hypothetical protein